MLTVAEIHKALGFNEFMSETTKVLLTQIANAAIAAYRAKLRQGVELPEPDTDEPASNYFGKPCYYTEETLLQYGDARDQAGYLRGLEDAAKVLEENAKQCSLVLERYVLEANSAVIRAMKGGE